MSKGLYREFYLLPRGEQRGLILLSLLLILSLVFRIVVQLLPDRVPEGIEEFEQEAYLIRAAFAEADSLQRIHGDSIRQKRAGSSNRPVPSGQYSKNRYSADPIDINRADSAQLLPLPGIGPVFAGRLIKYRNLLGGYVSPGQLKEVYGISLETLDLIVDRIVIDTSLIIKLDLNGATFRELLRHPYLEYEDVKALVNYRDFKGSIQSALELQENFILADSVLNRVIPYLYLSKSEAVDLSK
jgi:DNA uptake protein ComE-like DNA-binding protein